MSPTNVAYSMSEALEENNILYCTTPFSPKPFEVVPNLALFHEIPSKVWEFKWLPCHPVSRSSMDSILSPQITGPLSTYTISTLLGAYSMASHNGPHNWTVYICHAALSSSIFYFFGIKLGQNNKVTLYCDHFQLRNQWSPLLNHWSLDCAQ